MPLNFFLAICMLGLAHSRPKRGWLLLILVGFPVMFLIGGALGLLPLFGPLILMVIVVGYSIETARRLLLTIMFSGGIYAACHFLTGFDLYARFQLAIFWILVGVAW